MDGHKFIARCKQEVADYANAHLDATDDKTIGVDDVYVVWSCKALQNHKACFTIVPPNGMYYELTYNGDKHELYFDAYKKLENRCIKAVF